MVSFFPLKSTRFYRNQIGEKQGDCNDTLFILLIVGIFLVPTDLTAQEHVDIVYLKDGSRIVGLIIEQIPNKSIRIRTEGGSEFVYTLDKIERITKEVRGPQDLMDRSYFELGVTGGTPSGVNGIVGFWSGRIGLRVSGGHYGRELHGVQGNLSLKLVDTTRKKHTLSIVGGTMYYEEENDFGFVEIHDTDFLGIAYNFNWRGLFLEVGGAAALNGGGGGPVIQLGYMHRFHH